ncbi:MarR family transcriptional regulator [bacterium]|nr:MAG: MarR family transcriptional regulator [bacterium]
MGSVNSPTKQDYEALASFRKSLRRFLRFAEQTAREEGITPQQHQVILAVMGQEGRDWASISEIRDALQLEHHAAVGLVDRCQSAGLVIRSPHPDDRRVVMVSLTDRGRQCLAAISRRNLGELRNAEALRTALERL